MEHHFFSPTRLFLEKEAVFHHREALCALGSKALLVTTPSAAAKSGALADVTKALSDKGISFDVFDKVEQNPSVSTVMRAADMARSIGCDFFIGIGGGSALDAAKTVSLLAKNPSMNEESLYSQAAASSYPIACVGTTAGTGSEVTPYAVITSSSGQKRTVHQDSLYPALSLCDPRYLKTMPDTVLQSTALDAAAHCLESFFNRTATSFSDTFAVAGLRHLICEFETISAYGTGGLDDDDFETLLLASLEGGYAISLTGTTLPHTAGYYLTERFGIPHGVACAMFLPAFLLHNARWSQSKLALLCDELCRSDEELRTLIADVTPEISFTFSEQDIALMRPRFENNKSLKKCPGDCEASYVEQLYRALFLL